MSDQQGPPDCTPHPPQSGGSSSRARAGLFLMIAATTALGLFPSGARIAYQGGASPESVATLRHLLTFAFLLLLLRAAGDGRRSIWIPSRRQAFASLGLGVILAGFAWAYITAVRYIPVSLAVLLLYTFPAQVVLMAAVAGIERPSRFRVLAILTAFAGVALALGLRPATAHPLGIALGLLAGFGLALITILGARLTGTPDGRILAARMALIATLLTAALGAAGPGFSFPDSVIAWGGFLFAGAAAAIGTTLYFVALPMIGPVHASGLSNLEPVVAIIGAILILGERPGPGQFAGIALVVGAIALLQTADRRKAEKVRSSHSAEQSES